MDKAKAAVSDFMSKSGHHDTTVHEKVAPAVQKETIETRKHENLTTAVDKEVHQDHYHTSVQPVHHTEQLAEKHHHNIVPVEHRSFEHGNDKDVEQRLAQEAGQFKNETTRVKGETTHSANPVVAGEHFHHHVHETIQPVVQKQTIEPHVVHTTVPIHEVHHNAAQHHSTSALPAVSMADFKKQGGSLTGREERYDGFDGEPRNVGGSHGSSGSGLTGHHNTTGTTGSGLTGHHNNTTGTTGSGLTGHHNTTDRDSGLTGHHNTTGTTGSGLTGHHNTTDRDSGLTGSNTTGSGLTGHHNSNTSGSGLTGSESNVEKKKPGLLDRLNPMKDSDGDGKKGMMD